MPQVAAHTPLTIPSGPRLTSAGRARLPEANALLGDGPGPSCAPERPQSLRVSRPVALPCRKQNSETASAPGWGKGGPHYSSPTCLLLAVPDVGTAAAQSLWPRSSPPSAGHMCACLCACASVCICVMCVCTSVCMCICMHCVCTSVCMCLCVHPCALCVHVHVPVYWVHTYVHVSLCVMHVCARLCICAYACAHVCTCVCAVCACTCIRMHLCDASVCTSMCCVHVHMCACVYVCACVSVLRVCVPVCTCVWTEMVTSRSPATRPFLPVIEGLF